MPFHPAALARTTVRIESPAVELLLRALPFTTTTTALCAGVVFGVLIDGAAEPPPPISYVERASLAALEQSCAPLREDVESQLALAARDRAQLEGLVAEHDAALAALAESGAPDAALEVVARRRAAAAGELEVVRRFEAALASQAARVDERLVAGDAREARELSIVDLLRDADGRLAEWPILAGWLDLVNTSRSRVCGDEPTTASLDCQAALATALAAVRADYVACARGGSPPPAFVRGAAGDVVVMAPGRVRWGLTLCPPDRRASPDR